MEQVRKPFQGVWNIVRFNWHFYLLSLAGFLFIIVLRNYVPVAFRPFWLVLGILIVYATLVSLLVSFYVYDLSGLYKFNWLKGLDRKEKSTIININAGFDETSSLLKKNFKNSTLIVLDFYDSSVHTELSIKRARNAYPPFPGTQKVHTTHLPLPDHSAEKIFLIFAAHEVRDKAERDAFFVELHRVLKPGGQVIVMEHLRDMANFLAYNFGYLHFYSKSSWHHVFRNAGLSVKTEIKHTPFISTFILQKNGVAP